MSKASPTPLVALAAAIDLPDSAEAPDWVHLLPAAQGEIQTYDGRGPYKLTDIQAVIVASMQSERGLPIDENHAIDLSSVVGGAAPARGWITELQARADGLWGKVRWTNAGKALMADRAYRGISPVFNHTADKAITQLLRASLTNKPNLKGLIALNTETTMNLAAIAKALGLDDDATEEAIIAAIGNLKKTDDIPALQSAMAEIGTALGIEGTDRTAIIAAAKAKVSAQPAEITALQAELTTVTTQLNALTQGVKRDKATAFVDAAIQEGRQGAKPSRDRLIAMHMADPENAEAIINGLTILGGNGRILSTAPAAPGAALTSLNAEQAQAASLLGIAHPDYLATLNAERAKKETV